MSVRLDNLNVLFKPIPKKIFCSDPIKPNKNQCAICDNTGKIQTVQEEFCRNCLGTGKEMPFDLWSIRCPICNGFKTTSCQKIKYCTQCNTTAKL